MGGGGTEEMSILALDLKMTMGDPKKGGDSA